jgi:hypothetical protein
MNHVEAMKFTREINVIPAFDKRNEGRGQHNAEMDFILKSSMGAFVLKINTGWLLNKKEQNGISHIFPSGGYIGFHFLQQGDYGFQTEKCEYLNGKSCYGDGSFCDAHQYAKILVEKGSDAVFEKMEERFIEIIKENELYEEPKPEPKFKVGDRVRYKGANEPTYTVLAFQWNDTRKQWEYWSYSSGPVTLGRYSDEDELELAEEEWTYPCVVRSKLSKDIVLAIKDSEEDKNCFFGIYDNEISIVGVKDNWTVIATDLKNLEGV